MLSAEKKLQMRIYRDHSDWQDWLTSEMNPNAPRVEESKYSLTPIMCIRKTCAHFQWQAVFSARNLAPNEWSWYQPWVSNSTIYNLKPSSSSCRVEPATVWEDEDLYRSLPCPDNFCCEHLRRTIPSSSGWVKYLKSLGGCHWIAMLVH
jgi:hypothetical protein